MVENPPAIALTRGKSWPGASAISVRDPQLPSPAMVEVLSDEDAERQASSNGHQDRIQRSATMQDRVLSAKCEPWLDSEASTGPVAANGTGRPALRARILENTAPTDCRWMV
mmetsp:Transcript_26676/g.76542  ORF Transcript_26676/g.76542 Transcript_26676/m.76542 type:complete len:112 (-) Transcript_26676:114-449(-)